MSQQYEKLKTLLKELFQLDQPELDFGLYRVMHAKSAEIIRFLDNDLLPQVKEALARYQSADKSTLEGELAKAIEAARALGVDPEASVKVQELRARLKTASVDVGALEREVYDHLYSFFRRYYSEGDFLAKRVYKPGVYAIPYEGEEVTLYWANKDQYYIKTSEYLRDYAFRLRPNDDKNPMRVHFRLVDAAEEEHGNVKTAEGRERRFKLATEKPMVVENGELVIRFTYLPDPKRQAELNAEAERAILATAGNSLADWVAALGAPAPTESDPSRTVLAKHLKGYSDRNTFDYFIHKDLGGFLRRELDFFIKNEVMYLDDVETDTAARVEQYLSKIKVVRRIAGKLIDFLTQLEDFQKKLWLKQKFVVETSWCIRVGCIPERFYPEIVSNEMQRAEWARLCGIGEFLEDSTAEAYSAPPTLAFVKAHPTLVIDTRHYDDAFTARLLDALDQLHVLEDGLAIQNENFQALALLREHHRAGVRCIYIDPPYNTGSDGFAYKDSYQHSTWASMIADRLEVGAQFLTRDGAIFASIDEVEQPLLRLTFDTVLGRQNFVADMVWAAGRKNDSRLISVSHEYIVTYAHDREYLAASGIEWRQRKRGLDEIYAQYERLKRKHDADYPAMTAGLKAWYRGLPDSHPAKAHKHYAHVDERGVYFPADISWPGGGGPKYEVLHPRTGKPVRVPARGWMFSDPVKLTQLIADGRVHFGDDESAVPCIKSYLAEREYQAPYVSFPVKRTTRN